MFDFENFLLPVMMLLAKQRGRMCVIITGTSLVISNYYSVYMAVVPEIHREDRALLCCKLYKHS